MKHGLLFFIFTMCSFVLKAQTDCSEATTATLGTNTTPSAPYWYKYVVTTTGYYRISSVGTATNDTEMAIYSDCGGTLIAENDDFSNRQSQVSLELTENDTIYILWEDDHSSAGFDWTLDLAGEGEDCLTAIAAADGINTIPTTTADYYWYSYRDLHF